MRARLLCLSVLPEDKELQPTATTRPKLPLQPRDGGDGAVGLAGMAGALVGRAVGLDGRI